MAAITGKDGTIKNSDDTVVSPVENWQLNVGGNVPEWVDNTTGGAHTRAAGAENVTGSFEYRLDTTKTIPYKFGSTATLELHLDGGDDDYYTVPCIITNEPTDCQFDGSGEVTIVYEFGATGAISRAGILSASGI